MSSIDSRFAGEIFRKDQPIIIAQDRQLASIIGARLAYNASGYDAGTVVARNTVSGLFEKYNNAGASGLDTAAGVLFEEHQVEDFESATGTTTARVIVAGVVFKSKLVGLDSAAETDLAARTIIGADSVSLLKF